MSKQWKGRVLTLIALICLAFATLLPTITGFMYSGQDVLPESYKNFFKNRLILGLDLRGGSHLQYKVDVREALINKSRNLAVRLMQELPTTDNLKDLKGADIKVDYTQEGNIEDVSELTIKFKSPKHFNAFRDQGPKYLFSYHNGYDWLSDDGKSSVKIGLRRDKIAEFQESALNQAIETIERRINAFGVAESSVSRRDTDKIVVELPGLKDEESGKAKERLAQTGLLHFKIVEYDVAKADAFFSKIRERDPSKAATWPSELKGLEKHKVYVNGNTVRSTSLEVLKYMVGNAFDEDIEHLAGYEKMYLNPQSPTLKEIVNLSEAQEKEIDKAREFNASTSAVRGYQLSYLRIEGMSGENVEDAFVGSDRYGRAVTNMHFGSVDANEFADLTEKNKDRQLAILIDEILYSAPNIQERIGGGRVQITMGGGGSRVRKEAQALAAILKSGALQAPLRLLSSSTVGPTLGADSIQAGKVSVIVGFILVILFMIIWYRGRGIVATIALLLNLFFIAAGLSMFGATLTLPGIAGIVLTVGMAVDANVLIFERMKEEERKRSVTEAFAAGYEKAWSAILDANVTTGIAAIVLYQFGTGPIKGFAVTLGLGIISSMYTAIVVTRLIFEFFYQRQQESA